jgi:hypothetical protein
MDQVKRLIAQLEAAITLYSTHIPHAEGEWKKQLIVHRDWNLRIIADIRRQLAASFVSS